MISKISNTTNTSNPPAVQPPISTAPTSGPKAKDLFISEQSEKKLTENRIVDSAQKEKKSFLLWKGVLLKNPSIFETKFDWNPGQCCTLLLELQKQKKAFDVFLDEKKPNRTSIENYLIENINKHNTPNGRNIIKLTGNTTVNSTAPTQRLAASILSLFYLPNDKDLLEKTISALSDKYSHQTPCPTNTTSTPYKFKDLRIKADTLFNKPKFFEQKLGWTPKTCSELVSELEKQINELNSASLTKTSDKDQANYLLEKLNTHYPKKAANLSTKRISLQKNYSPARMAAILLFLTHQEENVEQTLEILRKTYPNPTTNQTESSPDEPLYKKQKTDKYSSHDDAPLETPESFVSKPPEMKPRKT